VTGGKEFTQPYWDGAARGELVIQRCVACHKWIHFPEPTCPACGSDDVSFEPVSGQGKVETFSVIHRSFVAEFAGRTPYVIAWIGLPEQAGLRVFANVTGCPPEEVAIGMDVEVFFEGRDGHAALPDFKKKQ
jgi:uncharacterized OB-fold protein